MRQPRLYHAFSSFLLLLSGNIAFAQVDYDHGGEVSRNKFSDRYTLHSADLQNLQWVKDPAGSERIVLSARIQNTDQKIYGGIRTEISPRNEYIREGVRWYAFSVYFPQDWEFHSYPTVVAQLHTSQKNTILSPPVSFVANGDRLDLELNFNQRHIIDQDPATKNNSAHQRVKLEKIVRDKWNCFVIRADWSYMPGKGALRIWMNGENVYDASNSPNSYETWLGNYPKVGLYSPGRMAVKQRLIYMDFVHMGGPKTQFNDMAALTPCANG